MGSFNETCALSNLNISPGDPVRLLFLTQNPYVKSDGHEAQRGCYHYDNWFARTPPIKGEYADYGQCEFKENLTTKLICEMFQEDVIERPFSFNQYHTGDVTKSKGIDHFIHAAWQGRLLVADGPSEQEDNLPDNFPSWRKIHEILRKSKLPIQLDTKNENGIEGYNAQNVMRGVVCVTFNSYGNNTKRLEKAKAILDKTYDSKMVFQFEDRKDYNMCLMVAPKGAFENPILLANKEELLGFLNDYPEHRELGKRRLPVLAVMIREDVWQVYCNVTCELSWNKLPHSVDEIFEKLTKVVSEWEKQNEMYGLREFGLREILYSMPFSTTVGTHLRLLKKKTPKKEKAEFLKSCAELARVEQVMALTHQPWHIPPLGGQIPMWELKTNVLTSILAISQKEFDKEKAEMEE